MLLGPKSIFRIEWSVPVWVTLCRLLLFGPSYF